MSYVRFRFPEASPPATPATIATGEADNGQSVATVATVARGAAAAYEAAWTADESARLLREWTLGLARLRDMPPPSGFAEPRWRRLADDGRRFLRRWGVEAVAAGWTTTDLFGLHPTAPAARYDAMGLVALIAGGDVVAITSRFATIRMASGSCLTYYLRLPRPTAAAAWNLDSARAATSC